MEFLQHISAQQHLLPPVIFLATFAIGLELRVAQFVELAKQPRIPILGTIIHSLTFPSIAVAAVLIVQALGLGITEATALGVLLIAACPSGGFSNILTTIARANLPLSIVLTAVSSILSFLSVPLLLGGFALLLTELDGSVSLPVAQILLQLTVLILIPIGLGIWVQEASDWATEARIQKWQSRTQLLLYLTVALMIVESWEIMVAGFIQALPWSIGLCATNIAACFALAKASRLENEDAITVALEGSIRNLGVAFLIAANTLDRVDIAVLPTVYFLTVLVISILFAKFWRRIPFFN